MCRCDTTITASAFETILYIDNKSYYRKKEEMMRNKDEMERRGLIGYYVIKDRIKKMKIYMYRLFFLFFIWYSL